jgi:hypothetical protein
MEDVNANDPWRDDSLTGVLKFSNWIRQNLMLFTIIIIAIAGIITYAKFKIRDGVY